ncbi:sensor histidine kinase [Acrocarpospora phusangensis]|uniref:histidine kinase n=1 Tax=Acrocarpospora phusangensis TaxID=1070424 RepID=A0A919Q9U2_9ACTN|nr:ATP-binding protein [Acrocarpospora phusangensis]GIH23844.1 sensor histidine kinase [Acrocarpospora phusangensis]
MTADLLTMVVRAEPDVFALRRAGREVAAGAGLDYQDQVRLATALSEVGREALAQAGGGTVVFAVDGVLTVTLRGDRAFQPGTPGFAAASRLVDELRYDADAITLVKSLPQPSAPRLDDLRAHLSTLATINPLDELRAQNQELLSALEDVQAQRDELEQTNHGVLALYTQLSEELEHTNQGVVALYAELEDKTVQLREASEAKTRFLASVSHELRAPASSILGLARMILELGEPLDDTTRHQIELIRVSGRDLLTLVNELLDLAKAESGRLEPTLSEVDIRPIAERLAGQLRPTARDGVALVVDVPDGIAPLLTDPMMLTQVLRNLVTNALKFTERGEVAVTVAEEEDTVLVRVSDTGIGIPAHQLDQIFEEFYQVRGPIQTGLAGTGLGLPYARSLAAILGGTLTVRSEVGVGSTFELCLPRLDRITVPRVLIADDDPAFRAILADLLRGVAAEIEQVGDGRAALAAIRRERPDLVLLDLRMPDLDGGQVLAQLRADLELRDLPVIVVTSAEAGPLAGAVAVLEKSRLNRGGLLRVIRGVGADG